jgi:phosphopantothenoylcysteine decarboxylase / phosphopantothenate---cysteine ligase
MKDKTVIVSAGPTREYIDPVRFISNRSSGILGYAIAEAAQKKGYRVILISGTTSLPRPRGVEFIAIETARELEKVLLDRFPQADILFMASAVCDFRPVRKATHKIKRKGECTITLTANADILKKVATRKKKKQIVCGFCIESRDLIRSAHRKLRVKALDYIVATSVGSGADPFGNATMDPVIIDSAGTTREIKNISKKKLAAFLITMIAKGL